MKLSKLKAKVRNINTARTTAIASKRITGRSWMTLRERVLMRDDYLCQHCLPERVSVASEVDHITPLHLGGGNNMDNLQSLCKDCHAVKTAGEGKERG